MSTDDFKEVVFTDLGLISFENARAQQDELVSKRISGEIKDTVIFCEHPPTLTLGKRTKESDVNLTVFEDKEIEVIKVDRGGGPTFHAPGQLVIYPVVSLRERRTGVKKFIKLGLEAISAVLNEIGLESYPDIECPGVWFQKDGLRSEKIAAAGLRIIHGVSNHGFSLNVNCDLSAFGLFSPCGFSELEVTSIEKKLLSSKKVNLNLGDSQMSTVKTQLQSRISDALLAL